MNRRKKLVSLVFCSPRKEFVEDAFQALRIS